MNEQEKAALKNAAMRSVGRTLEAAMDGLTHEAALVLCDELVQEILLAVRMFHREQRWKRLVSLVEMPDWDSSDYEEYRQLCRTLGATENKDLHQM